MCLHAQSCPALCNPLDCCLTDSSSHGILQARILELVAISFSKGSSRPRDQTYISCIQRQILHHCTTWEGQEWVWGETQEDVNPGLYRAPSPRWCLITRISQEKELRVTYLDSNPSHTTRWLEHSATHLNFITLDLHTHRVQSGEVTENSGFTRTVWKAPRLQ